MKELKLITDGACLGNPGPGGWACIVRENEDETILSGGEADTTNNRMEVSAVLQGLRSLSEPSKVLIISDSRYTIDAFEKNWIGNWKKNGWKTAARKPVKNQDLWEQLYVEVNRHTISWQWVKGHSGDPDNERVDQLAKDEAEKFL